MIVSSTKLESGMRGSIQSFISGVIVVLISFYQKYLSPLKGLSCAHRILHGSESCSGYVKRVFLEQDLMTAISMSQTQFENCSRASKTLSARAYENQGYKESKRRRFLQLITFGFFAQLLTGYKFECCFNPCGCRNAYKDDNDKDYKNPK